MGKVHVFLFRRTPGSILFLLLKRSSKFGEYWRPVTGNVHHEEGQTPEKAAIRVIKAETGIELKKVTDVGFSTFYTSSDGKQRPERYFAVEISNGAQIKMSDENDAYDWVFRDEAMVKMKWPSNLQGLVRTCALLGI